MLYELVSNHITSDIYWLRSKYNSFCTTSHNYKLADCVFFFFFYEIRKETRHIVYDFPVWTDKEQTKAWLPSPLFFPIDRQLFSFSFEEIVDFKAAAYIK